MDTEPTLTTELKVSAQIRASNAAGTPAFLIRRGEETRGTILLKLNLLEAGCDIWNEIRTAEGDPAWMKRDTMSEADANAYVDRALSRDPDLWVVEIEDRTGVNPFEGKKL